MEGQRISRLTTAGQDVVLPSIIAQVQVSFARFSDKLTKWYKIHFQDSSSFFGWHQASVLSFSWHGSPREIRSFFSSAVVKGRGTRVSLDLHSHQEGCSLPPSLKIKLLPKAYDSALHSSLHPGYQMPSLFPSSEYVLRMKGNFQRKHPMCVQSSALRCLAATSKGGSQPVTSQLTCLITSSAGSLR